MSVFHDDIEFLEFLSLHGMTIDEMYERVLGAVVTLKAGDDTLKDVPLETKEDNVIFGQRVEELVIEDVRKLVAAVTEESIGDLEFDVA